MIILIGDKEIVNVIKHVKLINIQILEIARVKLVNWY